MQLFSHLYATHFSDSRCRQIILSTFGRNAYRWLPGFLLDWAPLWLVHHCDAYEVCLTCLCFCLAWTVRRSNAAVCTIAVTLNQRSVLPCPVTVTVTVAGAYIHTCIHAYIHTYIHTCIHTYTTHRHRHCLVSSRLVSSRLVSSRLISSRLVSSRLVSSRPVPVSPFDAVIRRLRLHFRLTRAGQRGPGLYSDRGAQYSLCMPPASSAAEV